MIFQIEVVYLCEWARICMYKSACTWGERERERWGRERDFIVMLRTTCLLLKKNQRAQPCFAEAPALLSVLLSAPHRPEGPLHTDRTREYKPPGCKHLQSSISAHSELKQSTDTYRQCSVFWDPPYGVEQTMVSMCLMLDPLINY